MQLTEQLVVSKEKKCYGFPTVKLKADMLSNKPKLQ